MLSAFSLWHDSNNNKDIRLVMKIKLIYIILLFSFFLGIRVYNQVYSVYHPINDDVYEDISSLLTSETGVFCLLIPQKTYYRIGEKPQLDVLIVNKTDSVIYLPGCLDGSSFKLRYPVANVEILNKEPRRRQFCPTVNPLTSQEIRRLEPGECFNPIHSYMIETRIFQADSFLFTKEHQMVTINDFWPPESLDADNYLLPGKYQLQFSYSTKKDTNVIMGWNIHPHFSDVDSSFCNKIPEIELKSNIVTLIYRIF